ncbi:hypothetical protein B0H67DRAFT_650492 [Lasiosphaeris hirsuta]|uniref:DUF3604 domain-containing protein n=1 Tax=Lasiosphaeris hirsuta TaxID=260670 RepID=A0AA39ZPM5_9PEZI|nr:hypothetical protein B0H67DRAFT_650492 [Lasiosphaeris hirsuta]
MKTLSDLELSALAGQYFAPAGLYQHTKTLPFLGTLDCNTTTLTAGQWAELLVTYTVGASGLADGAWIKGTFKFYSDWALFQTTNPRANDYVSAEYVAGPLVPGQPAATVQSLAVRFDQKGHERPFQKAIIIDIVDGYMNPGDKILVRVGDRRWGAKGTRVQTFVESAFLMRWYVDPVGTSRFAPVKPDIAIPILPGAPVKVKVITPRVAKPGVEVTFHIHAEDVWGNATADQGGLVVDANIHGTTLSLATVWQGKLALPSLGWTVAKTMTSFPAPGDYRVDVRLLDAAGVVLALSSEPVTISASLPVSRPLFADLHVHSDDTVGTNSTTYNFSYAQQIAGLDVVGYTANDFNITASRWDATLAIIRQVNAPGSFIVFPGTEWCGNSAAGGDHNVVFLDDPATSTPEFPLDRSGKVARSFEWNEHGPAELTPGAWPLDEVYATYAHAPEKHLLIPHVGGRRCNLAWHHPRLERLLEIGSSWGLFEWLLRDAVVRGWKMGVCANSDEHRGRCGGGVPGTAVFGTKGGLTGVIAESLDWRSVGEALRARRTFATTGERLVGLVSARDGRVLQGDDLVAKVGEYIAFEYQFYGAAGFESVEAWDAGGLIFKRDLQREAEADAELARVAHMKLRVKWGGARLYDRYREAAWQGSILVSGAIIEGIQPFGGVVDNPEDAVRLVSETQVAFDTRTSGDFDGVDITFASHLGSVIAPESVTVTGHLGGYVKVGNVLDGNPHKAQPEFGLAATKAELGEVGGKRVNLSGGAELAVSAETLLNVPLPTRVEGRFETNLGSLSVVRGHSAVYFVAREHGGGKVITSPIFIDYETR